MNRNYRGLVMMTALAISVSAGCGGNGISSQPDPPTQPLVRITGQYDLVLISSNGVGRTTIYTDFKQTGASLTGTANTLVCPSNDVSKCKGGGTAVVSIIPIGTVSGVNVTLAISFPSSTGSDTVTMIGTAQGIVNLAGTFTDSLGDSGTWTASPASHQILPHPSAYFFSGTFNSTSNPLLIPPTISILVARGAGQDNYNILDGTATLTNWPCFGSFSLSGKAIGDAFSLNDTASKVNIVAVPTLPGAESFTFSYQLDPTSASCAGDSGRGELGITNPWDY